MKKIGILFGKDRGFADAFIEKVNGKKMKGIKAESVYIEKVEHGEGSGYAVIVDRISHKVPFYRSYLKNAALYGTAVINNPFWLSTDENFFDNSLASKLKIAVPKTVILPSRNLPAGTTDEEFSNLAYPLDWEKIFRYIGFPAYMKPFSGEGNQKIYKITHMNDFFSKHAETGKLVMMLQEEIIFEEYYRCFCIGGKHTRIRSYEPRNAAGSRYDVDFKPDSKKIKLIEDMLLRINKHLGYDFNTIDIALRDDVLYAVDLSNPAADVEKETIGQDNFDWVVDTMATYAIDKAQEQKNGKDNLTWGEYIRKSAS
jgi:glutathione synthase/RimK-type ligase-like ATP-grasp enzyme